MARKRNSGPTPRPPSTGPRGVAGAGQSPDPRVFAAIKEAIYLLERGDVQKGIQVVEQGMRIAPDDPDLLHLAGQVSLSQGQRVQGRRLVERAIRQAPKTPQFHLTLGSAHFVEGGLDAALKAFRQALRLAPNLADAHTNVGIALSRKGLADQAMKAFENAARLEPENPQVHMNLAVCHMELRNANKAVSAIRLVESLVDKPGAEFLYEIGNIYRGIGSYLEAQEYYRRSLEMNAKSPVVQYALGEVLLGAGEHDGALKVFSLAQQLGYAKGAVKLAMARCHMGREEVGEAGRLLSEVLDAGDDVALMNKVAVQYSYIGDFEAQANCIKRILQLDPGNKEALIGLVSVSGKELQGNEIAQLKRMVNDKSIDAKVRSRIGFALGDYYRLAKSYEDSFSYYRLGNQLKGYYFDAARYKSWIEKIEATFTESFFSDRASWGHDSQMPVLIVGMPRSGTTLTEQILSAHPDIHGAGECGMVPGLSEVGELPSPNFRRSPELAEAVSEEDVIRHANAYLHRMQGLASSGQRFVTNKVPHNFEHLGLFAMLFPRAPIIHVERDPRDTLLSIYCIDFRDVHDYAYNLSDLGHYYRLYKRLVGHWLKVIPNPVYSLRYEELVKDVDGQSNALAEFVGVDFDERMLRFFEQERSVNTASLRQVRQPVYSSSVARWKPYERHLKPLFDALDQPNR